MSKYGTFGKEHIKQIKKAMAQRGASFYFKRTKPPKTTICPNCKNPKERQSWYNGAGFCDHKCRGKYYSGKKHPHYNPDKTRYHCSFNPKFREGVRRFFNYKCLLCTKPQNKNKNKSGDIQPLDVHHVNYDKSIKCHEHLLIGEHKFVPLCFECHMKITRDCREPKKKAEWKKHFLFILDALYNGKCYSQ